VSEDGRPPSRAFLPVATDRFDASAAEEFGELVALIPPPVPNPFRVERVEALARDGARAARFDPKLDCLVITGPVAQVAIVVSALVREYGSLRVLIFHARQRVYVERVIGASEPTW
jgi:hypothetical protein